MTSKSTSPRSPHPAAASFAVLDRTTLFISDHENQVGSVEYDVHPDGEHFVMLRSRTSGSQLVVVLNATAGAATNGRSDSN